MDSFVGFFILLITYETATTTANAATDTTYRSPATTDITSETASTTENNATDTTYTIPVTTNITSETASTTENNATDTTYTTPVTTDITSETASTTENNATDTTYTIPVTTNISDASHTSPKAEPDHGTENTTNAPNLGPRSGIDFDTTSDFEFSTTPADFENSTHINLEIIKNEVLHNSNSTKEIIEKLEGASTSKPAEPLSKETTAKSSVTQGQAAGILIGSLIVAVAFICVTKVVYNRYKRKTYDVAQNNIELGNP